VVRMSVDQPLGFGLPHRHHGRMSLTVTDFDVALVSAVDSVRAFGFGEGRACYAGLHVDHRGGALIVFRVPTGGFDRRVRDLVGARARVIFQDAAHARIELEGVRDRVWDFPGSEHIAGVSVPVDGSTLKVALDGDAIAAQAWMNVTLPGLVTVTAVAGQGPASPMVASAVPAPRGDSLE